MIDTELAGNLKTLFDFETVIMKMAFFTNVIDLQAALSACLTVRDWETKPVSPIYLEEMKNYLSHAPLVS